MVQIQHTGNTLWILNKQVGLAIDENQWRFGIWVVKAIQHQYIVNKEVEIEIQGFWIDDSIISKFIFLIEAKDERTCVRENFKTKLLT